MKKINILMSTYNGADYIDEQIESIMTQENVDVYLTIRDDGSKDETKNIINKYIKKYKDKIELIEGTNLGYQRSFLECLYKSKADCDYYAFSDQDDVWFKNKLEEASKVLEKHEDIPFLYCCSPTICNFELKNQKINNIANGNNSLEGFYTRSRMPRMLYGI